MDTIYSYIMSSLEKGQKLDDVVKTVTESINNAKTDYDNIQKKAKQEKVHAMRVLVEALVDVFRTFNADEEFINDLAEVSDEELLDLVELFEEEYKRLAALNKSIKSFEQMFKKENINVQKDTEKMKTDWAKAPTANDAVTSSTDEKFSEIEKFLRSMGLK